ncbi:MAG: hypothetical protein ABSE55_16980 [Terracidiphilus sp.]|jgi:hypothetical protein
MESNLRPLTLGEILDRTAQLYRTNFLLFAGIFSVYAGVALVLNLLQIGLGVLLKAQHMAGAVIWMTAITTGVNLLVLFLLVGAATAAISRAVAWVHLGEPATIRGAYLSILPRLGRYLWLMTITAFRVWLPFVLLYAGLIGALVYYGGFKGAGTHAGAAGPPVGVVNAQEGVALIVVFLAFFVLLIPVAVYTTLMSVRYSLAIPACVVEDLKARKSIRRSIQLAKDSWGRIFLLMLLVGVIKLGLVGLTQFFVFVLAFKHPGQPLGPGVLAISQVIGFFTNSFLGPIWAAGITLFYYDQRVRKEGYDIEWMMQAAGLTVPQPAAAPAEPSLAQDAHLEPPPATQDQGSQHE